MMIDIILYVGFTVICFYFFSFIIKRTVVGPCFKKYFFLHQSNRFKKAMLFLIELIVLTCLESFLMMFIDVGGVRPYYFILFMALTSVLIDELKLPKQEENEDFSL